MGAGAAPVPRRPSLLTADGRAALPFRRRLGAALAVVAALHAAGLALLAWSAASGAAGAVTAGLAGLAYLRGLVHAFDLDHVSMIDGSTRKLVAEGRAPASVGLAFSAGHSTVVLATGALVVAGAGSVRAALDEGSPAARALGLVGLSVSGAYLLLVAVVNLATFARAWRLRRALRRDPHLVVGPDALVPRGPAARVMAAPLRRVRHPRHVYAVGVLFGLGFDTASQVGLLVVTAGAALAGAPPLGALCLPLLFAAAMTLADTATGVLVLRMCTAAQQDPARRVTYNLVVTGVSIASALAVAVLAAAELLPAGDGPAWAPVRALASLDTGSAGYLLAAVLAVVALVGAAAHRRRAGAGGGPATG